MSPLQLAAAAAAADVAAAVAVAAADPGTLSDERISALPCLAPPASHPRPPPRLLTLGHKTPGRSFLAVVAAAVVAAAAPAVAAAVEAHVHTSVPARTVDPADTCRSFAAAAVVAPAVADTAVGPPAYTDNRDYLPPPLAVVLDYAVAAVEAQLNIYARPDHLAAAVGAAAAAGTVAVAFAFPDATAVLAAASFLAAASSRAAFVSLA